jgi:pimeloyl-ACP methyl ester carboxylesterase
MHTTASMQRDAIARQDRDAIAGQDDGSRQHDAGALPGGRRKPSPGGRRKPSPGGRRKPSPGGRRKPPASSGHNPPLGSLYQVNGRRLMLHQSGPRAAAHRSGPGGAAVPAVVIAAGASAVGLDYLNVQQKIAEFTTCVVYDRGGTGWSDTAELPRSATEVASELRDLLRAAGIEGPYVFLAHSLGGAHVRRFAQLYPDQVAGLVYLETFCEDWDEFMPPRLQLRQSTAKEPGKLLEVLTRLFGRKVYAKMLAGWPDDVRNQLIAGHLSPGWIRAGVRERSNMGDIADELKAGGSVPDVPMIELTALRPDLGQGLFMSKKTLAELTERKVRLYDALVGAAGNGEHRMLPDATHSTIHVDRPDAVVQAVRDVVARIS